MSRKSSTVDRFVSKSVSAVMEMSLRRQADKIDVHRVNNTYKQGLQPFANQPRCKDVRLFFLPFELFPLFFSAFHDYVSQGTLQQSKLYARRSQDSSGLHFNSVRSGASLWLFISNRIRNLDFSKDFAKNSVPVPEEINSFGGILGQ